MDVGAGHGPWRPAFEPRSRYLAMDIQPSHGLDFLAAAAALPISTSSVDLVVATDILEHVESPDDVVAEMNRVLRVGGKLFISVPFVYGEHDFVDFQRWTTEGLRLLVHRHGFELLVLRKKGGIFRLLASIIELIPYQLLVRRTVRFDSMVRTEKVKFLITVSAKLLLAPFVWLISLFDRLDRYQRFTVGFDCIAQKKG